VSASTFAVVTTIQEPTPSLRRFVDRLSHHGIPLLVVGDRKGPARFALDGAELLGFAQQAALGFALAPLLPVGHYARKNLGYLVAMQRGAGCIYETDDDNAPLDAWAPRARVVRGARRLGDAEWANVYACFTEERVWPRGFPLERLGDPAPAAVGTDDVEAPVQQGLAEGSPDVDAVWRLTADRKIVFGEGAPVVLAPGTFCSFNSQSTWWWREAFPLLYLPSQCSFRMTDIWRSLVAQRCLWAMGRRLVFHGAEVRQERNAHRLLEDFRDEIPGYLGNAEMARKLAVLALEPGEEALARNMVRCYEVLVGGGWVGAAELPLLSAWLRDVAVQRGA
jgi:hypothetical protein